MITRSLAGVYAVPAARPLHLLSCTVTDTTHFTSACGPNNMSAFGNGAHFGYLIDRLALPEHYTAVKFVATAVGNAISCAGTDACSIKYIDIGVGMQDAACSTAGWCDFSTGSWASNVPGYYKSTSTSTSEPYWNDALKAAYKVMSTTYTTSTSTGLVDLKASATFDLTAAKRFIRCVVAPKWEFYSSGMYQACGGPDIPLAVTAIFGSPQREPFAYANQGPIFVSPTVSTATTT